MTTHDAYGWFTSLDKHERMWVRHEGQVIDGWPAMMTAAVRILNWLDDAVSDADLLNAVNHFLTCLTMEVFSLEQWEEEAKAVLREVDAEYARQVEVRA